MPTSSETGPWAGLPSDSTWWAVDLGTAEGLRGSWLRPGSDECVLLGHRLKGLQDGRKGHL